MSLCLGLLSLSFTSLWEQVLFCVSAETQGTSCSPAPEMCGMAVQEVIMCKDNDKPNLLDTHLKRVDEKRVIVFVNTKNHCDSVSRQLEALKFNCTVLHGGKTQVHHPLSASALLYLYGQHMQPISSAAIEGMDTS